MSSYRRIWWMRLDYFLDSAMPTPRTFPSFIVSLDYIPENLEYI